MNFKALLRCIALCVLVSLGIGQAIADDYPSRPIRIILPYSAGNTGDLVIRTLIPKLEEQLHQKIYVDYKPGAGGNIGSRFVANSPADGYTLLLAAVNSFAVNQFIYRSIGYDPTKDLVPITKIVDLPYVIFVNSQIPVKDVQSFIALAKSQPGKFFFASSGVGTPPHLGGELFDQLTGIKMIHVPYEGNGDSIRALLGNEAQVYIASASAGLGHLGDGNHAMHALALAWPTRLPVLPSVPSSTEAGIPQFKVSNWWGLAAPAGTPSAATQRLADAFGTVLRDPSVVQQLSKLGMVPSPESPTQFLADIKVDTEYWSGVVHKAGIKAQ